MEEAEDDVLAYMTFPKAHRTKLHSTNTLERLNREVKRRADVVGIFPNEASVVRLIGAVLMEANDEWSLQHRYLSLEPLNDLASAADEEPGPACSTGWTGASYTRSGLTEYTGGHPELHHSGGRYPVPSDA